MNLRGVVRAQCSVIQVNLTCLFSTTFPGSAHHYSLRCWSYLVHISLYRVVPLSVICCIKFTTPTNYVSTVCTPACSSSCLLVVVSSSGGKHWSKSKRNGGGTHGGALQPDGGLGACPRLAGSGAVLSGEIFAICK